MTIDEVPGLSPDGGSLTYREEGGGGPLHAYRHRSGGSGNLFFGDFGSWQFSISDGGRYIVALGHETRTFDTTTQQTELISDAGVMCAGQSNRGALTSGSALSSDGRFLAYTCSDQPSHADDTDGADDLFLWDRTTGASTRLTPGDDGLAPLSDPSVSDDGRFVVYAYQRAGDQAGTFLLDRDTDETTLIAPVAAEAAAISDDGSVVAFSALGPGDTGAEPVRAAAQ